MCTLDTFPPLPLEGFVTVCELNSNLLSYSDGDPEVSRQKQYLGYPEISVQKDLVKPFLARETARSAFIEHDNTMWKKLCNAWHEHGLGGVLEELSNVKPHPKGPSWVSRVASQLLGLVRWANSLHGCLFSHLALTSTEMIAEFSSHLNWPEGEVRCIAWHPHTSKLAVTLRDDSIKVYSLRKEDIVPTLKHKLQKGVAAVAWRPASASVLAVGCQTCVLIWHVDPSSLATRPSTSSVQVLTTTGHAPVTSLAWCPQGGVLLSSSPADTAMMVWDVAMETCTPLRRVGGGGVSLLNWAPDGSKVFAASPSSLFRVWECQTWTCEKWTHLLGRCHAACWSPDSSVLLFSTTEEPIIYSLTFGQKAPATGPLIRGAKVAVSCVDVSEVPMETDDGTVSVGGLIQSMAWDNTGERLAVIFKYNPYVLAVFRTRLKPVLEVIPCGYVRGRPGSIPYLMTFQPKFDKGALLTVVWSNGRVEFLPLYFIASNAIQCPAYDIPISYTAGSFRYTQD